MNNSVHQRLVSEIKNIMDNCDVFEDKPGRRRGFDRVLTETEKLAVTTDVFVDYVHELLMDNFRKTIRENISRRQEDLIEEKLTWVYRDNLANPLGFTNCCIMNGLDPNDVVTWLESLPGVLEWRNRFRLPAWIADVAA